MKIVRIVNPECKLALLARVALIAVFCGATFASLAADRGARIDLGKREFDSNCASCHGLKGKGDGVNKPYLTKSPSDLTVLAKRNGGVFPINQAYEVIDGRKLVAGHGSSEMPVWGTDYSIKAAEYYIDVPYDPEVYVRTRILALIDYLYRLQEK